MPMLVGKSGFSSSSTQRCTNFSDKNACDTLFIPFPSTSKSGISALLGPGIDFFWQVDTPQPLLPSGWHSWPNSSYCSPNQSDLPSRMLRCPKVKSSLCGGEREEAYKHKGGPEFGWLRGTNKGKNLTQQTFLQYFQWAKWFPLVPAHFILTTTHRYKFYP